MMERVEERGRALGRRAVERNAERVADMLRAELPDAAVVRDGDRLVVHGRRLRERPVLRWIGWGLR